MMSWCLQASWGRWHNAGIIISAAGQLPPDGQMTEILLSWS